MPFRHAHVRLRRTLMLCVLLAFVLAQCLGLLHRVVHSPLAVQAGVHSSVEAPRGAAAWVKVLFAGHDTELSCDLYDQAGHADLAWGETPSVDLQRQAGLPAALHPGWQLAAQAAGFLARGPPARV